MAEIQLDYDTNIVDLEESSSQVEIQAKANPSTNTPRISEDLRKSKQMKPKSIVVKVPLEKLKATETENSTKNVSTPSSSSGNKTLQETSLKEYNLHNFFLPLSKRHLWFFFRVRKCSYKLRELLITLFQVWILTDKISKK